jgi:hypothetical protein
MSEPTDAVPPEGYTFTKPEGLLAHYTKASTAFEDILPGKLRLSPYRLMRDPAENKDIEPSTVTRHGRDTFADAWALIKAERDRMRVLSFTRDAEERGGFPDFDCCWARPRMWEQYGDEHRGACLLFDPIRLERAIREQWPDDRTRHLGNVEYGRDGSTEVYRRTLIADQILSDAEPARAAADYINTNRDAHFFLKSDDFATEYEYRVVLAADDDCDDYAWIDYEESLVGVVLGERVPEWQRVGALRACSTIPVRLGRMEWPQRQTARDPRGCADHAPSGSSATLSGTWEGASEGPGTTDREPYAPVLRRPPGGPLRSRIGARLVPAGESCFPPGTTKTPR